MRRFAPLTALLALAAHSHGALTITIDPGQWTAVPLSDKTFRGVTGTLTASGQFTSISIPILTVTGPAGALGGATLNDAILTAQQNGAFVGVLFYLPVLPTTATGTYQGSVQFRVRIGQTSSNSPLTAFTFEVRPVPEPPALGALALGGFVFLRRRR